MKEAGSHRDVLESRSTEIDRDKDSFPNFEEISDEIDAAGYLIDSENSLEPLPLSQGTATLDLTRLLSSDVTESGSFDLRGMIWTTDLGKLLQAVPLMTFLIDESGKIMAANQVCQKLGPEYEELNGVEFTTLFHSSSEAAKVGETIERVFHTRQQSILQASVGADSNRIWGRITFRSIRLGLERLIIALVEDLTIEQKQLLLEQKYTQELTNEISKRRLAEIDLIASEERYRQVVESANDMIYTTDNKGRFSYLNPLALQKTRYLEEELLGRPYQDVIHPDVMEEVTKWYLLQASNRTPQTYYEFPILAKDGTETWIGQNVQLLVKDDKVTGFQAIARDITDRKIAEERLRSSLKEKEVLMREIHHRVKNNLQVISALLTLQADHVEERKAIEVLTSANARLKAMALVHEKLYESENLAQIRIDEYISDLVDDLMHFSDEFAARVVVKTYLDKIYFDPDTAIPIGLVVTEVLTNAMKHAFPDNRHGAVELHFRSLGKEEFELIINDDGIGISEEVSTGGSRSLGLDLVAAFAKRLNGNIRLGASGGTKFAMKFRQADA